MSARGTLKASKVHMMSTLPCPELDSLRLDYELTLRAGAEIEFPLVGSSIETTESLATALDKSGARIRRTMAAKRINAHKEWCPRCRTQP